MTYQKTGWLFLALPALLVGCGDDDEVEDLLRPPAIVTFYNFSTDRTTPDETLIPVSVLTALSADFAITDADYSVSDGESFGLRLDEDTQDVGVTVSNKNGDLASETLSLEADLIDTVIFTGDHSGTLEIAAFRQDFPTSALESDEARVRVIHVLNEYASESLVLDLDAGPSSVAYKDASDYVVVGIDNDGKTRIDVETSMGTDLGRLACPVSGGRSYEAIIAHEGFDGGDPSMFCFEVVVE